MKIIALGNINSGQHIKGDIFTVDDEEALSLIKAGAAQEVIEQPVAQEAPVVTEPVQQQAPVIQAQIIEQSQLIAEAPAQPIYQAQTIITDIQLN